MKLAFYSFLLMVSTNLSQAQNIADFVSVEPQPQNEIFVFPNTHVFQKIIEAGDLLTDGTSMPPSNDFTGYVPILGSSTNGYLSINKERNLGGVTVLDISLNAITNLWETSNSQQIDFSSVVSTTRNCSGTVTPWNTIVSSEEVVSVVDSNNDNYNDLGWNVEIDPATKTVINKIWAMGNFRHENIVVHSNHRTAYQGADSNPGYLYKFVADIAQNLHSGLLYVYVGSKNGSGNWILLNNTTPEERNSTLSQSAAVGATAFNGIEDVEIGPDGLVYFAVKGESRVYRFQDSDPISGTTAVMETFVGDMSYNITHNTGVTAANWGYGNDNLAFDNQGNLWVYQDGGLNYIWVVEAGHTQAIPKVKLFGIAPLGSEPTGITFSPDFKYLFMSIQHPSTSNNAAQVDAAGETIQFNNHISLVIALQGNLGNTLSVEDNYDNNTVKVFPNPINTNGLLTISGISENIKSVRLFSLEGRLIIKKTYTNIETTTLQLDAIPAGVYFLKVNNKSFKIVVY